MRYYYSKKTRERYKKDWNQCGKCTSTCLHLLLHKNVLLIICVKCYVLNYVGIYRDLCT